jgi:hypothetical protein
MNRRNDIPYGARIQAFRPGDDKMHVLLRSSKEIAGWN